MYVIGLYALLLFITQVKAKLTDDPHDMRMEDFEISRKQWNKKEMRYVLKFSRCGEVIKTSEARHRHLRFAALDIHGGYLKPPMVLRVSHFHSSHLEREIKAFQTR